MNTQISVFNNARNAIDKLVTLLSEDPEQLPEYIFLDLAMPEMDGWAFLSEYQRLKLDPLNKVHIFIVSSSVHKNDIIKSMTNPLVEDFIHKPIELAKIKTIFEIAEQAVQAISVTSERVG